ncbi:MAG TPA: VOC family protein [Bacteroidota bacterium]
MFKSSIPVLHVRNSAKAEVFYCHQLGFRKEFSFRSDETSPDPCFMGLVRDDAWLHVSSFPGDGLSGSVAFIFVDDVDALYAELVQKKVRIDLVPTDQTWGNREMYLKDPDGNRIRFGQAKS